MEDGRASYRWWAQGYTCYRVYDTDDPSSRSLPLASLDGRIAGRLLGFDTHGHRARCINSVKVEWIPWSRDASIPCWNRAAEKGLSPVFRAGVYPLVWEKSTPSLCSPGAGHCGLRWNYRPQCADSASVAARRVSPSGHTRESRDLT